MVAVRLILENADLEEYMDSPQPWHRRFPSLPTLFPFVKTVENSYTPVNSKNRSEITTNHTFESNTMALLEQQLHKTCDHHRIDLVYAFGSRACEIREFICGRGEIDNENSSDVDMGVKSSPKRKAMSVREKVEMAAEIEDLLGVGRVDLVILSEADPFLSANIVRGERIFCRDPYAADEYELYILRRAGDLAPLEKERLSLIFDSVR
jgi:predicted nucleotidyltransferase